MKIKKGDTVEVLSGNYKGVRGTVNSVDPESDRVVVSGVNIVKKHQRRTGDVRTQVGIIEREAPIRASKVALVPPVRQAQPRRLPAGRGWNQDPRLPALQRGHRVGHWPGE